MALSADELRAIWKSLPGFFKRVAAGERLSRTSKMDLSWSGWSRGIVKQQSAEFGAQRWRRRGQADNVALFHST